MINKSSLDTTKLDIPDYIDQPDYVKNKAANYVLQSIGWFFLMWLFFPIISILLWLFEGHLIYDYIWVDHSAQPKTLYHFALLIGGSALILIVWASYNWIRFRGDDRRSKAPNYPTELLASQFFVDVAALSALQQAQRIVLHYDQHGILQNYELGTKEG